MQMARSTGEGDEGAGCHCCADVAWLLPGCRRSRRRSEKGRTKHSRLDEGGIGAGIGCHLVGRRRKLRGRKNHDTGTAGRRGLAEARERGGAPRRCRACAGQAGPRRGRAGRADPGCGQPVRAAGRCDRQEDLGRAGGIFPACRADGRCHAQIARRDRGTGFREDPRSGRCAERIMQ